MLIHHPHHAHYSYENSPNKALAKSAMGKLVLNPQTSVMIIVFNKHINRTGFRPHVSDALPQGIAVAACAIEKDAETVPVQKPTSAGLTPGKDSIIAGRYGYAAVRAIGSDIRTIAVGG
jgi:hypothetical protein